MVAEPCGVIGWGVGGLLLFGGAIGAGDTVVEWDNMRKGTNYLPGLERIGHGFGGEKGQEVGKKAQMLLDVTNLTKSTAGMVNTIELGGKMNKLDALDNINTIDGFYRDGN